jgi:mRNA-degrading endonuclease RelE of RelBE toxin-antitoxin system
MRLIVGKAALRALGTMPTKIALSMMERLRRISADPFTSQPNVERIQGVKDGFRLRQGDWRALYRIDRERDEMLVDRIAHRREVYR